MPKIKTRGLSAGQVVLLSSISYRCVAFSTVSLGNQQTLLRTGFTVQLSPKFPEHPINGYDSNGYSLGETESDVIIDTVLSIDETDTAATRRMSADLEETEPHSNRTGSGIVPWTQDFTESLSSGETSGIRLTTAIMDEINTSAVVALLSESVVEPPQNSKELKKAWLDYDSAYTILSAALIGAMTGFAVAVFKLSVEALREVLYGSSLSEHVYWWLIPAIGGLAVGLLTMTGELSPGLRGTANEVDLVSLSTNDDLRFNSPLRFLRKPLGAIITLGSGNSLGPEGPSVEIGMTFSRLAMPPPIHSGVAMVLDEKTAAINRVRRNRLLLSAGAAAGVSAGFNAPLAGVFFALEIVQQGFSPLALPTNEAGQAEDFEGAGPTEDVEGSAKLTRVRQGYFSSGSGSITAILLSSVLSALVAKVYLGEHLVLHIPPYNLNTPLVELPMYMLLGVTTGVVAATFTAMAQGVKRFLDGEGGPSEVRNVMSSLPQWFKPVIGGLVCGIIAVYYPQILFFGYETLNSLMGKNALPLSLILTLLGLKIFATAVSAGSGLVGGTFAPALFLGGMTGAAFHRVAEAIVGIGTGAGPFMLADVQAYALVGAAGVLSGLFRAPLTASLILFELTRDYDVILPLMVTASVASVVGDAVEKALEETRRDRDAVSWGDLADAKDAESDQPRQ